MHSLFHGQNQYLLTKTMIIQQQRSATDTNPETYFIFLNQSTINWTKPLPVCDVINCNRSGTVDERV